jgi:hypothetical protein
VIGATSVTGKAVLPDGTAGPLSGPTRSGQLYTFVLGPVPYTAGNSNGGTITVTITAHNGVTVASTQIQITLECSFLR